MIIAISGAGLWFLRMGNSKSSSSSHDHRYLLCEMPQSVRDLYCAVILNEVDTVKVLVDQGVNINFPWYNPSTPRVKDGSTPLILAVSYNFTEIVEVTTVLFLHRLTCF